MPCCWLILHQQVGLRRSVRLMAAQASQVSLNLVDVGRIHHVRDRMIGHRVAQSVLQAAEPTTLFFLK